MDRAPDVDRTYVVLGDEMLAVLGALAERDIRGVGVESWARPFAEHPLTFVLDVMSDGVLVCERDGEVLYRNRAAEAMPALPRPPRCACEQLTVGAERFERRCIDIDREGVRLQLEVVRRLS